MNASESAVSPSVNTAATCRDNYDYDHYNDIPIQALFLNPPAVTLSHFDLDDHHDDGDYYDYYDYYDTDGGDNDHDDHRNDSSIRDYH